MDRYALQNRLVDFGVQIIKLSDQIKRSSAGMNLTNQISRSCVSPALNYAEAQDAESKRDFRHKIKIALKELRETSIALQIVDRSGLTKCSRSIESALKENNELISIFVSISKSLKV